MSKDHARGGRAGQWVGRWLPSLPVLTAVAFPFLAWAVIGLTFQRPIIQDVPVVVVDHSASPLSRTLIRNLDATQVLKVVEVSADEVSAANTVRRGEATLGVIIPEDFYQEVRSGGSSEVTILSNGAQLLYSKVAYRTAATTITTLSAGIQVQRMRAQGMTEEEATARAVPVRTIIQAPGNSWYDYGVYLIPSMAMAILQMSASFSALWLFHKHGDRNTRIGLPLEERRWRFLVRRAAPLLLANLVAVVLLFLVIFPLSGIPYAPAFFSLFWRTTLFVVVCMGMGAFISVLSKDLVFAAQVGLVINAPAFVFSGFTYPRWAMPDAVRGIANLIPLTHFLDGLVPLLMFGADVWTGIPGLLVFLLTFWGGVVLLTGRTGARFREWQGSWRHRSAARVPAPQHSTPGSGPSGPLEGRGP